MIILVILLILGAFFYLSMGMYTARCVYLAECKKFPNLSNKEHADNVLYALSGIFWPITVFIFLMGRGLAFLGKWVTR